MYVSIARITCTDWCCRAFALSQRRRMKPLRASTVPGRSIHSQPNCHPATIPLCTGMLVRRRRKAMSRRIVQGVESSKPAIRQGGYVYKKGRKKGEPWNPKELSYGRYRVDIPGQPGQREVRAPLGYCRDEMGAMLKLQQVMGQAGVLDVGKVRERIASSSATTFRAQAAWLIQAMTTGEIVHAKKRTQIDPNTIDSYSTAIAYLNEQVGDKPLASIDNPEAKNVVAAMKSAAKNGKRRFSDKSIVTYFQILKKVIASALDDKFRPVHQREWHLAAIGLPRVNPKKQLR